MNTTLTRLFVCGLALVPVLTGCGGGKEQVCPESNEPYLRSRDNPLLKVPDGLAQPNRSEALAIPEVKPGARSGRARGVPGARPGQGPAEAGLAPGTGPAQTRSGVFGNGTGRSARAQGAAGAAQGWIR